MEQPEHEAVVARALQEPEDEPLRAARARSEEADIACVSPATGAMLRFLARVRAARTVAEIGTGGGYSGLWLLGGIDPRGTLTTIEIEPDRQVLAQRAFAEAGETRRVRSMLGPALSVLPKLADGGYDLVFVDAARSEYPEYFPHARRLLRPGGVLIADDVVAPGPQGADPDAGAIAAFLGAVGEDAGLHPVLLRDGVLAAHLAS